MDKPKYDIFLGSPAAPKGYRARSIARSSAPQIAPRFSSGAAGPTDLDLLKSASIRSFIGGMFQRDWSEINTDLVARVGGAFNKYDEMLYPAPRRSTGSVVGTTYAPLAKAESEHVAFVAFGMFSAGNYYNIIQRIDNNAGNYSITIPAGLVSNGIANISGLTLHKKYLFVASQTWGYGVNCQRYDTQANTWQDIGGGIVHFCAIRGLLYGINYNSDIFTVTNETAAGAATYTKIDTAGWDDSTAMPTCFVEYNGAGYIAKADGIYRFDGVKAQKILKLYTKQLCVYNGAMYFFAGSWLYRFDGANIVRLQYFGNQERASQLLGTDLSLSADTDNLYISTVVTTTGYATTDKDEVAADGLKRLYVYDGSAFYLWHETDVTLGVAYTPAIAVISGFVYDIFGNTTGSYVWTSTVYTFNINFLFDPTKTETTSMLSFTSSEHDDGFPNIFKSLEKIEIDYTNMVVGDVIDVKYQYYDGNVWSEWIEAGQITSTDSHVLEINETEHKLYKRLKVSAVVTPATDSTIALKGASIRYTLQPRTRWRWELLIMAEGNKTTEDRAGDKIEGNANSFTNEIIKSIKQKTPIVLFTPDYARVATAADDNDTTLVFGGELPIYTDPYQEYPLIAVQNINSDWEILRVLTVTYDDVTNKTTVTIEQRGYLEATPASIEVGAEVRLCFRVYANRLLRDAPVLDETVYNQQDTGESQLQREFLIELIEI